jgi:hypothetical protein
LNIESNDQERLRMLLGLLALGSYSADTSCDRGGFQTLNVYYWSDREDWGNSDQAYVRWEGLAHYLGIKGSYIAQEEGSHWFRVVRNIYGASAGLPDFWYNCEHESRVVSGGGNLWDGGPYSFHPYFRYRTTARYQEGHDKVSSELELQIGLPGGTFSLMTSANGGRACEESGCADMSLSRDVWSCRPNPPSQTPSHAVEWTRTENKSGTAPASPTLSPEFSSFPHSRRGMIMLSHIYHVMFLSL